MKNIQDKINEYTNKIKRANQYYIDGKKDLSKQNYLDALHICIYIVENSSMNKLLQSKYMSYGRDLMEIIKTKFEDTPLITFDDVAGLEDVKKEIQEKVIKPLKYPDIAKNFGITPGAKILLYGPAGTGKTFIAQAIAGELGAKFYNIRCQDILSKYVGESEQNISNVFKEARKHKVSVIFFDEFDAIAKSREKSYEDGDKTTEKLVATLLPEIDGANNQYNDNLLILVAATNRPWTIDKAMLRGGRFETHIYVGTPNEEARKFLIDRQFKNKDININFENDSIKERLVNMTNGYGCADIVNLCNKIKHIFGYTPLIIIASTLTSDIFIEKSLNMGASYFVAKPYDENQLCNRIEELIAPKSYKNVEKYSNKDLRYSKKLDEKITNIFISLGIPAHIKGFHFLRDAVKLCIETPEIINSITKKLYPEIATKNNTTSSKVERAIRHAIEVAWNRGKIDTINSLFGIKVYQDNEKPTNGEFIALISDKMLLEIM